MNDKKVGRKKLDNNFRDNFVCFLGTLPGRMSSLWVSTKGFHITSPGKDIMLAGNPNPRFR
jgi:hypothetical protein